MATYSNSAREVEMPNGDVVVLHSAPTGGANTTSNIKKFKYDDNGHVTESTAANATDLNLNSYSTPTTGSTAIGTSDAVQTAIGKLDHQSQIDQSNILYAINTGVRNICTNAEYNSDDGEKDNITYKTLSDGTITLKTPTGEQSSSSDNIFFNVWFKDGNTVLLPTGNYIAKLFGSDINNIRIEYSYTLNGSSVTNKGNFGEAFEIVIPSGITGSWLRVCAKPNTSFNSSFKIVVCDKTVWNTYTPTDYIPPALPNYDLTRLEAEDRASLAEEIDAGAKNKLDCNVSTLIPLNTYGSWSGSTYSINSGTTSFVVNSNLTITASKSDTGTARSMTFANYTDGSVLNGMVISGGTSNVTIIVQKNGGNYETYATSEGSGALISGIAANTAVRIVASIASAVTCSNVVIRPMLCTKAAFGVSQKFVPYAKSNYQLTTDMGNVNAVLEAVL